MNIKEKKKKNGQLVYQTSLYLGVDSITGKKVRTTITGRTKKEVQLKARQKKLEFEQKGSTVYKEVKITYFSELVDLWFDTYRLGKKPNTVRTFESIRDNYLLPAYGNISIDKISTLMMQTVVNRWARKAHEKTTSNSKENGVFLNYPLLHSYAKRILKYAVSLQLIAENPAVSVEVPPLPRLESSKKFYFTEQEIQKILFYLDSHNQTYQELYDYTLYKLLLATGLRIGEAVVLEWADIDFEKKIISVTKTINYNGGINSPKTQTSIRTIDIDNSTVAMLASFRKTQQIEAMKLGRREETIFSTFQRKYPVKQALKYRLHKMLNDIGIEKTSFHAFRHTHASLLLNAGVPYKQLQLRLGHAKLNTTMDIYAHLTPDSLKETASIYEQKMRLLNIG